MDQVGQFASNEAIVAATAGYPVYALDSAADSFELACEIGVGSVHAWTHEDVVKNDNGERTLILGYDIARELITDGHAFRGPVVLVARPGERRVFTAAGLIPQTCAVLVHSIEDVADLAAKVRPLLAP